VFRLALSLPQFLIIFLFTQLCTAQGWQYEPKHAAGTLLVSSFTVFRLTAVREVKISGFMTICISERTYVPVRGCHGMNGAYKWRRGKPARILSLRVGVNVQPQGLISSSRIATTGSKRQNWPQSWAGMTIYRVPWTEPGRTFHSQTMFPWWKWESNCIRETGVWRHRPPLKIRQLQSGVFHICRKCYKFPGDKKTQRAPNLDLYMLEKRPRLPISGVYQSLDSCKRTYFFGHCQQRHPRNIYLAEINDFDSDTLHKIRILFYSNLQPTTTRWVSVTLAIKTSLWNVSRNAWWEETTWGIELKWEDNIRMDLIKIWSKYKCVDWINLLQHKGKWRAPVKQIKFWIF
jgi:hypothetical protein